MRAFKRYDSGIPLIIQGRRVHFESASNTVGVVLLDETKEGPLVAELDRLAEARKMGVVRISLELREELLKKKSLAQPKSPERPPIVFDRARALPPGSVSSSAAPVVPPAVNQPTTIRPSKELAELLKSQGKPVPAPITVKPESPVVTPKSKANKIAKADLPKPPHDVQAA